MEGENYMKKRGRVLILLITAALAIERFFPHLVEFNVKEFSE